MILGAQSFRSVGLLSSKRLFSTSPSRLATAPPITWNRFFELRQQRRRIGQVCSIGTTFVGLAAAYSYFANIELDLTQKLFGVEVIYVYGACIVFSGVLGYLMGPTVGNALFRLRLGAQASQFTNMETNFLRRVKINRPNPLKQSYVNPITDYYGEKINSLSGYRRWLRDARVYKRKSETFL